MKKIWFFMMVVVLSLCIIGCNNKDENEDSNNNNNNNTPPITNNDSNNQTSDIYKSATESGYTGTYEEWLETIKGAPGKSAYELAVEQGYTGTVQEWLEMLKGDDGKNIELKVEGGFIQWKNEDATTWNNLISLDSIKGESAKEIELSTTTTHVVWRYVGTEEWTNLLELSILIPDLPDLSNGKSAYELAVELGFEGSVDEWLESLKGTNGKSAYELAVEQGYKGTLQDWLEMIKGVDGKNIELKVEGNFIQWKKEDSTTWNNLISLEALKGENGKEIELSTTTTHVVWRYKGTEEWTNLLELSTLIPNVPTPSNGKSAYELAVELGFEGSIEDWLESLKGSSPQTPEFSVVDGYLCWRYVGDESWIKLFSLDVLKPEASLEKHTVTFVDPDGNILLTQEVLDGKKATKPESFHNINGYDTIDWKLEDESWSFIGYSVTEDITLTQVITPHIFTISYVLNGGVFETSYFETFNVENNMVLKHPSMYLYKFDGWYLESDFQTKVTSTADLPLNDVILYAKFNEPEQYKITYELNGGMIEGSYADVFTEFTEGNLPVAKKEKYVFDGWYIDENFTRNVEYFTDLPLRNVTIYAKFIDAYCNELPDAENCQYVDTWHWKYNKFGFNGKGMEIVILVNNVWDMDPFRVEFTGERKLEKQKQIVLIEQVYNIDIVYRNYPDSAAWGPVRVAWLNENTAAGTLLQQGHIYEIASDWGPTLIQGNSIAVLENKKLKNGIFSQLGYNQTDEKNKQYSVGIKVYGYSPSDVHADHFLYYNQQLVKDYGLEDPATLWNEGRWDYNTFYNYLLDVQEAFDARGGEKTYAFGGFVNDIARGMLAGRGHKLIDNEAGTVMFTNPNTVELYFDLREIYAAGMWAPGYANDVSSSFSKGLQLFTHGQLWFLSSELRFKGECDFPIGIVPYPTAIGAAKANGEIVDGYLVPMGADSGYAFSNVSNGENGLSTLVLVNIMDDISRGLVPEFDLKGMSARDQYIAFLSKRIQGEENAVDQIIAAVMSIEDNIKNYGYTDYMDIVSKSVGGGSDWNLDGFAVWGMSLVTDQDTIPQATLTAKKQIYQDALDEILAA